MTYLRAIIARKEREWGDPSKAPVDPDLLEMLDEIDRLKKTPL